MYWAVDIHKYHKGLPHTVENTFYFKDGNFAEAWISTYNFSNKDRGTVARDLRAEKDEVTTLLLTNFFKKFREFELATQTELIKFMQDK